VPPVPFQRHRYADAGGAEVEVLMCRVQIWRVQMSSQS